MYTHGIHEIKELGLRLLLPHRACVRRSRCNAYCIRVSGSADDRIGLRVAPLLSACKHVQSSKASSPALHCEETGCSSRPTYHGRSAFGSAPGSSGPVGDGRARVLGAGPTAKAKAKARGAKLTSHLLASSDPNHATTFIHDQVRLASSSPANTRPQGGGRDRVSPELCPAHLSLTAVPTSPSRRPA